MTIRTKWHRAEQAIADGRVRVYTGGQEINDKGWLPDFGYSSEAALAWMQSMNDIPRFVVEPSLVHMVSSDTDSHLSMRDMQRAHVLRLPFDRMIVELRMSETDPCTNIVVMVDMNSERNLTYMSARDPLVEQIKRTGSMILCMPMIYATDGVQDIVGLPPSYCFVGMAEGEMGDPLMQSVRFANPLLTDEARTLKAMESTKQEIQAWSGLALMCATALMITEGVEAERVETTKLNRRRTASGKTRIPEHTYIKIGRVFRSAQGSDSETYCHRKSPRPHWRRGHLRTVRHGAGRELHRVVFIKPRLVAMRHDSVVDTPSYVVGK